MPSDILRWAKYLVPIHDQRAFYRVAAYHARFDRPYALFCQELYEEFGSQLRVHGQCLISPSYFNHTCCEHRGSMKSRTGGDFIKCTACIRFRNIQYGAPRINKTMHEGTRTSLGKEYRAHYEAGWLQAFSILLHNSLAWKKQRQLVLSGPKHAGPIDWSGVESRTHYQHSRFNKHVGWMLPRKLYRLQSLLLQRRDGSWCERTANVL